MTSLFESAKQLYNHGARKFLYMNVPPLSRTPVGIHSFDSADFSAGSGPSIYSTAVKDWNQNLTAAVDIFRSQHNDVRVEIYDSYSLFNSVLDDPTAYDFDDPTSICTGEHSRCVWFDHFHPGSTFYKVLAANLSTSLF
jgi:phospholipase/lecithinase/hemolysin